MRYDFSSQFLRVQPPENTFGDAWEALCYALLSFEHSTSVMRLKPPDMGLDILDTSNGLAYQCKAHEQGASGTMPSSSSIDSLRSAHKNKEKIEWQQYCLATNANYSGEGVGKILQVVRELGLTNDQIKFKGPEYWDNLCTKHSSKIMERFDYRVSATEKQVIDTLRAQGYYDRFVKEYGDRIEAANYQITVVNNRTPVELHIPFSPDLTVEHLVDVVKGLLGVSLNWSNFDDLNTSAGPSISLTIDRMAQPFSKTIGELDMKSGQQLEFWIKITYRDQKQKDAQDGTMLLDRFHCLQDRADLRASNVANRNELTVKRAEAIIQSQIWRSIQALRGGISSTGDSEEG